MTKTTADYIAEAKAHEDHCEWALAAECWGSAIRLYPRTGPLADLHKAKMEASRAAAASTAKWLVETDAAAS